MRIISDLIGTLRQSFKFGLATLTAVLTAPRTYTFPDKNGTVAMLDDVDLEYFVESEDTSGAIDVNLLTAVGGSDVSVGMVPKGTGGFRLGASGNDRGMFSIDLSFDGPRPTSAQVGSGMFSTLLGPIGEASGDFSLSMGAGLASGEAAIAVGIEASATAASAIALGAGSAATHAGSVALGGGAATTATDQVHIGDRDLSLGGADRGIELPNTSGTDTHKIAVNDAGQVTLDGVAIGGGGGSSTLDVPASEALLAGDLVNIHSNTVANARKANATDGTKPANGFVLANVSSAATASVHRPGEIITGLTGLTPDSRYYLSTTAGAITTTPPSTSGNVVQYVGTATSTTSLFFDPEPPILLS